METEKVMKTRTILKLVASRFACLLNVKVARTVARERKAKPWSAKKGASVDAGRLYVRPAFEDIRAHVGRRE
jgi:hypothetical protein